MATPTTSATAAEHHPDPHRDAERPVRWRRRRENAPSSLSSWAPPPNRPAAITAPLLVSGANRAQPGSKRSTSRSSAAVSAASAAPSTLDGATCSSSARRPRARSAGRPSRSRRSSESRGGGAGADPHRGEAERAVDQRGGHVDGPDPVERRGQHVPVQQAPAQLHPALGDPEARGQVAEQAQRDRHQHPEVLPRPVATGGRAGDEQADQHGQEPHHLADRVDQEHPRVQPLPLASRASFGRASSRGVALDGVRLQGQVVHQPLGQRAVQPLDPERAGGRRRGHGDRGEPEQPRRARPRRSRRSGSATSARSAARAPTSRSGCRPRCRRPPSDARGSATAGRSRRSRAPARRRADEPPAGAERVPGQGHRDQDRQHHQALGEAADQPHRAGPRADPLARLTQLGAHAATLPGVPERLSP